jgi:hypothetical protein
MSERYIVIGGNPFTMMTGHTVHTSLFIMDEDDNLEDLRKRFVENNLYDQAAGLVIILDTQTNTIVDG